MKHLLNWVLSAVALWIVAHLISGFHLTGPFAALIAALVIGFVNATLGVFLNYLSPYSAHAGNLLAGDQCSDD